ncbi:rho guanine nucleotide exchange factor 5 [Onthophagus taurus]|uniref:rho guanine nucleotide exchange factor 5 n=1 Tax=Onthophagus taurus TaxID=166361 RepID=UPI0039BECDBE
MALPMNPVVWPDTAGLHETQLSNYIEKKKTSYPFEGLKSNTSFLYSTTVIRRSIEESRAAFLNLSLSSCEIEEPINDTIIEDKRPTKGSVDFEQDDKHGTKKVSKRISYKIKRSSSAYRAKTKVPIKGSNVAELTSKFDKMIAEKKSILEDPKFAKFVKRVNSDSNKLTKKPSVKIRMSLKPEEKPVFNVKKPTVVVRRVSVKKSHSKPNEKCNDVYDRISQLNSSLTQECKERDEVDSTFEEKDIKRESAGNVKAAIQIFEKCGDSKKEGAPVPPNISAKPKPKVPEKKFTPEMMDLITKNCTKKFKVKTHLEINPKNTIEKEIVQETEKKSENVEVPVININIPIEKPKRSESAYELLNQKHFKESTKTFHSEQTLNLDISEYKPNSSFLYRYDKSPTQPDTEEDLYDVVNPPPDGPPTFKIPPNSSSPQNSQNIKTIKPKMPEPDQNCEKMYEELKHTYIYPVQPKYEDIEQKVEDDGYEAVNPIDVEKNENIYEVLPCHHDQNPPPLPKRQVENNPPALPAKNSYYTIHNLPEIISNGYESIGSAIRIRINGDDIESNYEVLGQGWGSGSNRDSIVSSDQQSNSLYGRSIPSWTEDVLNYKTTSVSSSDRSDEWEDLPDDDEKEELGFSQYKPKVREKQKISKKTSEWSQQLREQWSKSHSTDTDDADSYHHYESVRANGEHQESHYESDSFDSDSDYYENKPNMRDSGVDMENTQLPDPPNNQTYVFTRLASAGKRMKRLLTKNDITKSLSRMTKRKSRTDLVNLDKSTKEEQSSPSASENRNKSGSSIKSDNESSSPYQSISQENSSYQNIKYNRTNTEATEVIYEKQAKKRFFTKFRRSMSLSAESASELTQELNKPKSTFYLTDTIDVDNEQEKVCDKSKASVSPSVPVKNKTPKSSPIRPMVPPPPLPTIQNQPVQVELRNPIEHDPKRTTSWYAECGLFKNNDLPLPNLPRRPNTCWYAEVGLYQSGPTSTPSTSSTENSGNNSNNRNDIFLNMTEEYYNLKNDNHTYYQDSPSSINSNDSKTEKNEVIISGEMQQLLQDEPLYQLYDAALSESYCKGETLDLDYEEVSNDSSSETQVRPSAMELILKNGNSVSITRTLWCEIPEVKQSAVLSTLSLPQKKLQEAKFEMMTSEASYLNSLNVLNNHFIKNLYNTECLSNEEKEVLFGKIPPVKNCSEKLLQDLEKCWQDSILLHQICDVIKKHAEENFNVYVQYCENQVYLDSTLKRIKDRTIFNETLERLEKSTTCQALTLYSFLMLPMQRITRWPLLLDAVLKRLCVTDREYITCQEALATINKIVKQCNEAARNKERETEILALKSRIDFGRFQPIDIASHSRYLVKSGPVTHLVTRGEDVKLTFGRRFSKVPLFLFLFNDLFMIAKYKSVDDSYVVVHHCPRNFIEINVDVAPNLSSKDAQGRHLFFLTILENQEEKLIEMLLSCNTDTDRERWLNVLMPINSQDPDETLYERWDCPQVTAVHDYVANQADELTLIRGDVIYVNRKMADGWYYGEKISGGECGWFPSNYIQEIANPHVRARNLRQRYRLLAFSEHYLKTKS